jgi:serine/threonine protein kinase
MSKNSAVQVGNYSYFPHKLVGQGSFATVYEGFQTATGQAVAVKKIRINEIQNRVNKLWSEIKIMKRLDHQRIVKLYDVHLDANEEVLYLFLEWCDRGDLSALIKNSRLSEREACHYFNQIREGMEFLSKNSIVHRDIKPQNILLQTNDSGVSVKICDFGLSTLADTNSLMNTMCGSPMYMAPEVIAHETYTVKSDLWSLGVILYELIYQTHPYPATNYYQLTRAIKRQIEYPESPAISNECIELLRALLQYDCLKRIEWSAFFQHKWFTETNLQNQSLFHPEHFVTQNQSSFHPEHFVTQNQLCLSVDDHKSSVISDSDTDELYMTCDADTVDSVEESRPIAIKEDFKLSRYRVDNYHNPSTSLPVGSAGFKPVSFSPKANSGSVGSQVFRYMSKSLNKLKF